jgi:acyl-CoA synthetase (AMP-forming)/AMP-acid ligase II
MAAPVPNLGALLARRAALTPGWTALIDPAGRIDFGTLDAGADHAARCFHALGIRAGDRVGLLLPNGRTFAEAFFGLARLGAVACGLNTRLGTGEIREIASDAGLSLILHDPAFAALAEAAAKGLPTARRLTVAEFAAIDAIDPPPLAAPAADDLVLLVYTSGTIGRAKGVCISHDQMLWASLTMAPTLDMRPRDVHLLPVPMFHVGGLSFTVHCVHLGASLAIPPRWDAAAVLDLIEAERVAHFFAVPTMLSDLLAAPGFAPDRLASVRWIMGGGAPVPEALIARFDAMGIPLMQTCGATETCGPGLVVDADNARRKAGSVGRGFFHTEVRLVDDAGTPVAPMHPGEIQLRARHIASGYWQNPQATEAAFTPDGWFRTGDIGTTDADGFVTLVDRRNNKIITGGENVYPAEVERVLLTHPGVADVAVVGLPESRWGEIVAAVVVQAEGQPAPDLAALQAHCDGALARYKHPRRLLLGQALPRNATGKLLRRQVLEMFSDPGVHPGPDTRTGS